MFEGLILAAGLTASVDSLSVDKREIATAVVRVVNEGTAAYSSVYVNCAFLDDAGTAVITGSAMISNLEPNETAFGSVKVDAANKRIRTAECRIGMTQP